MQVVIHTHRRGVLFTYYDEPRSIPAYGFSARAAYAIGHSDANHPVPSVIGPTTFGRISILTWQADERADRPAAEYWNERKTKPAPTGWR